MLVKRNQLGRVSRQKYQFHRPVSWFICQLELKEVTRTQMESGSHKYQQILHMQSRKSLQNHSYLPADPFDIQYETQHSVRYWYSIPIK